MKAYEVFHITRYEWDEVSATAKFYFQLDDEHTFCEIIAFPKASYSYNNEALQSALASLHVALGLSYYKTCIPKTIAVHTNAVHKGTEQFFRTLYEKGLGEFWYKNQIDWRGKISFKYDEGVSNTVKQYSKFEIRNSKFVAPLVPIGGGKDSLVTIELLKKAGITPTVLRVGSHPLITKQAQIAEVPLLEVVRTIDPKLKDLNEAGALNGHIPITAIVSIITLCTAILHGNDAVLFSNERSANEGNTMWNGLDVNHQWSKSFEFETLMREHIVSSITTDINYFSLLRPLSEVAIVRHFARYPQYYFNSTSSNANWRIWEQKPTSLWGTDEKSAFVFAIYLTALEDDTVLEIFEQNLFTMPELLDTYRALLGVTPVKPFECVGTKEETVYAFLKCFEEGKFLHTEAMQLFKDEVLPNCASINDLEAELYALHDEHYVPEELLPHLVP